MLCLQRQPALNLRIASMANRQDLAVLQRNIVFAARFNDELSNDIHIDDIRAMDAFEIGRQQ